MADQWPTQIDSLFWALYFEGNRCSNRRGIRLYSEGNATVLGGNSTALQGKRDCTSKEKALYSEGRNTVPRGKKLLLDRTILNKLRDLK